MNAHYRVISKQARVRDFEKSLEENKLTATSTKQGANVDFVIEFQTPEQLISLGFDYAHKRFSRAFDAMEVVGKEK